MADDATRARVALHYGVGGLERAICAALEECGKSPGSPGSLEPSDLSPVDEFHIGGLEATTHFAQSMQVTRGSTLLDVGAGIGGASRYFAQHFDCRVTGVDITHEFVELARKLAHWVGFSDRTDYKRAGAHDLPFDDEQFDGAYMLHVGMNIEDKAAVFAEIHRVLKPGSKFGVYDVMQTATGELAFPVPWSDVPETSFLSSPEEYEDMLRASGFEIVSRRERRDFAIEFFRRLRARLAEAGPPPLGLHLLMGATTSQKVANMIANIENGRTAPAEVIARKAD